MSGRNELEPRQLFERRVARDTARLRAYEQVYKQIEVRIRTTAELPSNPNYVLYTVPPFILGLPAIDMQDCIVYIVHKLRTSGFMVRFTYPNLLYISWQHYEQEYMRDQNPITQAMKPPPPPTNFGFCQRAHQALHHARLEVYRLSLSTLFQITQK